MRVFALVAAVVGLVIFAVLYFQLIEGRLQEALANPRTIGVVILPFLPAVVLSIIAERAQARFIDFMQVAHGTSPGTEAPAKPRKK